MRTPSARVLRSLMAAALLAGCGARTVLREPADGGDGDATVTPDVLVTPDVPATPDLPVTPDAPPGCADFQTLCNGRCVDPRSDNGNCGACGLACGDSRCVAGRCQMAPCAGNTRLCGVRCVDVGTDPTNCGVCGNVCLPEQTCTTGRCMTECGGGGRVVCGRLCVDPLNDRNNCGGCGLTCMPGTACTDGRCTPLCSELLTACGGVCVDTRFDARNCGACGLACPAGLACASGTCTRPTPLAGTPFRIQSLGSTRCRAVEHNRVTGDDRGGIAVSSAQVFYTGDTSTGRFDLDGLTGLALGRVDDGLVSDLATGQLYSLRVSGRPIDANTAGGSQVVTELAFLDGVTGAETARALRLSRPVVLPRDSGIFAGFGRVVLHDGARAYDVDLTSGQVADLGAVALAGHQSCESWAYWGVAEFFGGSLYLAYVRDQRTIVRTQVSTGMTTTVGGFAGLSDMCSFTVSAGRSRWYWHHEGGSQFSMGDESIGFCDASLLVGAMVP